MIQEIGKISNISDSGISKKISIESKDVIAGAIIGDSIAVNGVCLTVVEIKGNVFVADVMHETINRSNLKLLKKGSAVNLEKSITLSTPLGGHIVYGDVDCTGKVISIKKDGIAFIYEIAPDKKYMKYIVEKGRVSIDGASLTVMALSDSTLKVSLIPHSQEKLILGNNKVGDIVNIETDLIGKHIERLLSFKDEEKNNSKLSEAFLRQHGF